MTMAVAVNLFRNVAKEGFPPEYIATRLNDTLAADNESGMFVTMFIAEINLSTGQMNFCNAGHTPPLIVDRPIEQHEPCRPKYLATHPSAFGPTLSLRDRTFRTSRAGRSSSIPTA